MAIHVDFPGVAHKVLPAVAGMGFTSGPKPKGILLSGQNVKIGMTDQYGNGVTVESNNRASTVLLPLSPQVITQVTGVGAGKDAYVLLHTLQKYLVFQ